MNSSVATTPIAVAGTGSGGPARNALIVGVLGLAVALIGLLMGVANGDSRPLVGWLIGFAFWFSMSIGMLYLVMLFYLFDAGWPIVIRRQLEHALAALPVLACCFVPLLLVAAGVFGADAQGLLWKWLNPNQPLPVPSGEHIAMDPLYVHKSAFLNMPFFLVRLVIYAAVFLGISGMLRRESFAMDHDTDPAHVKRCRFWSAFGVYAVSLATTFAAFDFYMSLTYQWFSTMYGVWYFATSMRCGLCGTVIMCYLLSRKAGQPLYGVYGRPHQYLLGCLCLTFTIFWAYVTFSQYFLIYNANLPEETFWFNLREMTANWTHNSWWWVGLALVFGYFFLPFFALLSYYNKVRRNVLPLICLWILFFHLLDLYFNILPGRKPDPTNVLGFSVIEFVPKIWDLAAWLGIGGMCVWAFLRSQAKTASIPIHDPRIEESLHYHE